MVTGLTTLMTWDNGNVGIGTTSPGQKLDIVEDANAVKYLNYFNQNTGAIAGAGLWIQAYGNNVILRAYGDNHASAGLTEIGTTAGSTDLALFAGSEKIRIKSNGNVGIGTTSIPSAYKLAVDGKVIAEEFKVLDSGSWPDHVFQADYDLMPLPEVERYIAEHQHLPDVPSAKEVAADGLSLGQTQAMLLQKVEELTLYVIDLTKENEALKARMDRLEK